MGDDPSSTPSPTKTITKIQYKKKKLLSIKAIFIVTEQIYQGKNYGTCRRWPGQMDDMQTEV